MISLSSWFPYSFTQPWWFLGLILVPALIIFLVQKENKLLRKVSSTRLDEEILELSAKSVPIYRWALIGLKSLILVIGVLALAGPFSWKDGDKLEDYEKGIDIILALDVSLSMYAKDFEPNRLEAAKRVAQDFVSNREGDRVGLVVYAGEAYTACPATLDYKLVMNQLGQVSAEHIDQGTAIGVGLGTAVSRLQSDSLSSKVVILLTDGSNNRGNITPAEAAELAAATGVRVYTIGVGTNGQALTPIPDFFGIRYEYAEVEIDEETLKDVASKTGGQYYRATDEKKLREIYSEIEALEKQRFLNQVYEGAPPVDPSAFLFALIGVLILVWIVERTFFPYVD